MEDCLPLDAVYKPPYSSNHPVTVNVFIEEFFHYIETIITFRGHRAMHDDHFRLVFSQYLGSKLKSLRFIGC